MIVKFPTPQVPSDVSLTLAQRSATYTLAQQLGQELGLDQVDINMLRDCLVGGIAGTVDEFMNWHKKGE